MSKERRTSAEWEALLSRQASSGQGVKAWCEANGINVHSIYNQIAKRRNMQATGNKETAEPASVQAAGSVAAPAPAGWQEVNLSPAPQHGVEIQGSICIEIGGMRLAADAGYPASSLAAVCRELLRTC